MKRLSFLLFCLAALGGAGSPASASGMNPDAETLRKRFSDSFKPEKVNPAQIKGIIGSFSQKDSLWPSINYEDLRYVAFAHTRHWQYMIALAEAYTTKGTDYYRDPVVRQTFMKALGFWLSRDFIGQNWHNNEIGTPTTMVTLLYLMEGELSPDQERKMLEIASRATEQSRNAQGGDRVKIVGIKAQAALYARNEKLFEEMMRIIEDDVRFTVPGRTGLQYDYSFHHRHDRVNNSLSYGYNYGNLLVQWAEFVAGTRYAFSDKALRFLTDYYLDGICKQLAHGKWKDPALVNREIASPSYMKKVLFRNDLPERLLRATDYRSDELREVIRVRTEPGAAPKPYAKFFWQTEYFSFQRPHFFTSVRMHSTRNQTMEHIHTDMGLLNHYRGDGTNYLTVTGDEYVGIPPANDWRRIPGTTIMQTDKDMYEMKVRVKGLTDFVGGVDDGLYGAAVFDFVSPHDPLKARKSWFFFDDEYVCLGAGITGDADFPVATTLNQCRLEGDVTVKAARKKPTVAASGNRKLENVEWVYHEHTGYIFPEAVGVNLSNQAQKGTWASLSRLVRASKDTVSIDMFKLWIDHGPRPADASYAYVVVPAAGMKAVEQAAKSLPVTILSNTPQLQAVRNDRAGVGYAVFYEPGNVTLGKRTFGLDAPGMLMVRYDKQGRMESISVSDPSRKRQTLTVTVDAPVEVRGENYRSAWDPAGKTSTLVIDLPQDQAKYAGKSVTIRL